VEKSIKPVFERQSASEIVFGRVTFTPLEFDYFTFYQLSVPSSSFVHLALTQQGGKTNWRTIFSWHLATIILQVVGCTSVSLV